MEHERNYYTVVGPPVAVPILQKDDCQLIVRQHPPMGRLYTGGEKIRPVLDPPPVIQMTVSITADACQSYLLNPNLFMQTTVLGVHGTVAPRAVSDSLVGNLASSLHRLKDENDNEGGFFIFGDLSFKVEGIFKLQFNLFEKRGNDCFYIDSISTIPFYVVNEGRFMGAVESTALTRKFCNQGMRLRLRKHPRVILRKDGPASDDYLKRQYNKGRRAPKNKPKSRGPQTKHLESKPERPTSAPLQPTNLRPALAYTPAPPHTPQQEIPSQHPTTVIDPHLQSVLMRQQRPSSHSPHASQPYAEPQHKSLYSGDQSTQNLSFEQSDYSLPPMAPSIPGQLLDHLDHDFSQLTQPNHHGVSSQPVYYHQQPQYLAHLGISSHASPPSNNKPAFPHIDQAHGMPQGTLNFGGRSSLTPRTPLLEEGIDISGNAGRVTDLDGYHIFPHTGQNLSAGSIGGRLSSPPSNGAMQRRTSGGAY